MEFFVVWVVCILVGALIGKSKGRADSGAIWSAVLGPIGWLIVALQEDLGQKCPECGGTVVPGARKCKHCGSVITRASEPTVDQTKAESKDNPRTGPMDTVTKKPVDSSGDITFDCPRCGQRLAVEQRGAGISVNCPSCNKQIEIPPP
jgi:DNA-directed RNA polymerase subunit M/transcription elongation factor TFIIS